MPQQIKNTRLNAAWWMRLKNSQFIHFVLVGGAATGLQYLLLILLVELTSLGDVICSALAFSLSAVGNYLANYYLTFKANKPHSETFIRFVITAAIGLGLNTVAFWLAEFVMPHYLLSQMLATGVTLISNFLLHKCWIYR